MCGYLEHCCLPFLIARDARSDRMPRVLDSSHAVRVRSEVVKVAGEMALTIIRKEAAMTERVITMSFGLARLCQLNLPIIP